MIICTVYLPMANMLSSKVLIFSSVDVEIVVDAFVCAENQDGISPGFYAMGCLEYQNLTGDWANKEIHFYKPV